MRSFTTDPSVDVYVTHSSGGEIASKLTGYFIIADYKFRFSAIAFGRIGGHNISLKISKKTTKMISEIGYNVEELKLTIQRKLIEGDIHIPEGLKPPN
jgi:hypothetical protein